MMRFETLKTLALTLLILGCWSFEALAQQGRPPLRKHTATKSQPLKLVPANKRVSGGAVDISQSGNSIRIKSNGVPTHPVGAFPNRGNPHAISRQRYNFKVAANPRKAARTNASLRTLFGVGLNGVPFDPGAGEFWQGNPRGGWQYEALGGAVPLGLDANYAHVQPGGIYHYHGLPTGLMSQLGWSASKPSPLIGYAADGFPVYAITANISGRVKKMRSSYRLKSGSRPGGSAPSGRYDGTFVQDYQYVAGAGDLDECNGATVRTAEYPNGTYAYFLSETFPVIPRCFKGQVDRSFAKRR
ncbi:MAG: YHYH protein [Paracoccaceae bacterium]